MTGDREERRYRFFPAIGDERALVVAHPGIFATHAFFLVSGSGEEDVVTWLRGQGLAVALAEPLGLGANRLDERTGALVDGRAVTLEARADELATTLQELCGEHERLLLLGHSFGGTTIHAAALRGRAAGQAWVERLAGIVTLGSPVRFAPERAPPWSRLYSEPSIRVLIDAAHDGWVDLVGFLVAQAAIAATLPDRILGHRGLLRAGLALGPLLPGLVRRSPMSTLLYEPDDYSDRLFRALLTQRVLERESAALLETILRWGMAGKIVLDDDSADLATRIATLDVPILTVGSDADVLVTPAEAVLEGDAVQRLVVTPACGHGGYLTRVGTYDVVRDAIGSFTDRLLRETGP